MSEKELRKLPREGAPQCKNCFYGMPPWSGGGWGRRECHLKGPWVVVNSQGYQQTVWPSVSDYDWCGEWREKAF